MSTASFKFSVNNWNHLYSLEQAILRDEQATGKKLSIEGTVRNEDILNNHDTLIHISFNQVDDIPQYHHHKDGHIILGQITRQQDKLESTIPVSENVFEELRKNLMEYADIDGINIIVSIGIISDKNLWPINTECAITKLDYAMKGDA